MQFLPIITLITQSGPIRTRAENVTEVQDRWLSPIEPDPRDLLVPFPSELMMMWPISTRVNKPDNDDPSILEPLEVGGSPTLL